MHPSDPQRLKKWFSPTESIIFSRTIDRNACQSAPADHPWLAKAPLIRVFNCPSTAWL
jgi:hypothetical protein